MRSRPTTRRPTGWTPSCWPSRPTPRRPMSGEGCSAADGSWNGRSWRPTRRPMSPRPTTASTSYRATSYALADRLVVPSAYIASADCVCPPAVASAAPTYSAPPRVSGSGASAANSRPRTLRSQPDDRSSMSSNVEQPASELDAVGPAGGTAARRDGAGGHPEYLAGKARGHSRQYAAAAARASRDAGRPPAIVHRAGPDQSPDGQQAARHPTPRVPPRRRVRAERSPTGGGAVNPRAATNPNAGANNPGAGSGAATVPAPTAPAAPAESDPNAPPAIGPPGEVRRESYRPSTYAARPVRSESAQRPDRHGPLSLGRRARGRRPDRA